MHLKTFLFLLPCKHSHHQAPHTLFRKQLCTGTGHDNIISDVCPLYLCMSKDDWQVYCTKKMPTWINIRSNRHSLSGAWGRECSVGKRIINLFRCILSSSTCVQNFIEFESMMTKLCFVLYSLNILASLVTSHFLLNQQFRFRIFLRIASQLRDRLLQ